MLLPEKTSLQHDSTLGCLPLHRLSLQLDEPCHCISQAFAEQPKLPGILLFDDDRLHSLVSRTRFLEIMNQPYSKELFSQRKIKKLARQFNAEPLLFSSETQIREAVETCLQRGADQFSEPIVVCHANSYAVIDLHELLLLHARIFSRTVVMLQERIEQSNRLRKQLEKANKAALEMARLDGLTGIPNRRCLNEFLGREWKRIIREQKQLSVILIDIDFFKAYNDTYGHQTGDETLTTVAHCLSEQVGRPSDMLARYGGEEFLAILPDTPLKGARQLAEKMRRAVSALQIPHEKSAIGSYLSISCGISCIDSRESDQLDNVILSADKALYRAKEQGRNQSVIMPHQPH